MNENQPKQKCAVSYCKEEALTGSIFFKTHWRKVRITPSKEMLRAKVCRKHLLELLSGEDLPGLGRLPGSGVRFMRKAFCGIKKESVSAEACFACFNEGTHQKHLKHLLCQDTNLRPSPLDRYAETVAADKDAS